MFGRVTNEQIYQRPPGGNLQQSTSIPIFTDRRDQRLSWLTQIIYNVNGLSFHQIPHSNSQSTVTFTVVSTDKYAWQGKQLQCSISDIPHVHMNCEIKYGNPLSFINYIIILEINGTIIRGCQITRLTCNYGQTWNNYNYPIWGPAGLQWRNVVGWNIF